jgi:hypothetical protein
VRQSSLESRPADASADGTEGNTRLTSLTGLVLLVMLAIEGFTVSDVRGWITLHVAVGALLVGPILLKIATTGYRFFRYYTGAPEYVRKGAPNIVLRALGPIVVLASVAVIGTGIALGVSGRNGAWGNLHRAAFAIWFIAMTVHVLGHLIEVFRHGTADLRRRAGGGRGIRLGLVVLALAVGVGTAVLVVPASSAWTQGRVVFGGDHHGRK